MRITIENTMYEPEFSSSISIDVPSDDLTLVDVMERLVKPALIAFGFSSDLVEDYFTDSEVTNDTKE